MYDLFMKVNKKYHAIVKLLFGEASLNSNRKPLEHFIRAQSKYMQPNDFLLLSGTDQFLNRNDRNYKVSCL
jgi:hypothetical protein